MPSLVVRKKTCLFEQRQISALMTDVGSGHPGILQVSSPHHHQALSAPLLVRENKGPALPDIGHGLVPALLGRLVK
jgi:hypothetical protein